MYFYVLFEHFPEDFLYHSWSSKSPDLNLIENIWAIIQSKLDVINLNESKPKDAGDLEERVHKAFNEIDIET